MNSSIDIEMKMTEYEFTPMHKTLPMKWTKINSAPILYHDDIDYEELFSKDYINPVCETCLNLLIEPHCITSCKKWEFKLYSAKDSELFD